MATASDDIYVKLTVDPQAIVWYIIGDQMPKCSGLFVDDFIASEFLSEGASVRVAGTPANASLLIALYEQKLKVGFDSLQVGTPLCCESADERKDPQVLLYNMRSLDISPSLGGWHEVDLDDYTTYLLASYYYEDHTPGENTRAVIIGHPAWPALSFIGSLDIDACAQLIATVVDPRWYIDVTSDPNRGSKLEQYLGLNPKIYSQIDGPHKSDQHKRCRLVQRCWKAKEIVNFRDPRNFVWRAWASKPEDKRGLAANKLFISFLRQTWLQGVCRGPQASHLFVPEHFFKQPDEILAYKGHIARARKDKE